MRKINLIQPENDEWESWCETCVSATQECLESVERGEKPTFRQDIYRPKRIKEEYFFSKEDPFYGKCAYCDTYISDFQHGDIEHFRPKGRVTDENDNVIALIDDNGNPVSDENGQPLAHPGYYWLAYDWHNLLPSCTVCNQPKKINGSKVGKRNRFPVAGSHAQTPEQITNEMPLLINPASDDPSQDPETHLFFDHTTGLLGYKTEQGKMCNQVFGFNVRDQLIEKRRSAYQKVLYLLHLIIDNDAERDKATAELLAIQNGKHECTIAGRAAIEKMRPILSHLFK